MALPLFLQGTSGPASRIAPRRGEGGNDSHAGVRETARQGLQGPAQPLPFADTIQRAFGPHEVGTVRAFVAGPAGQAARNLGARAYAFDGEVAFGQAPDLRAAAHEAAHVIQQRAGAAPSGPGALAPHDLETQADDIAEAVVTGRSAAPWLDRYSPDSQARSESVQRQHDPGADRSESYGAGGDGSGASIATPMGAGQANVGSCRLRAGTLRWTLVPQVGYVNARIEFTPNSGTAASTRTISFIQTVAERTTVSSWGGFSQETWARRTEVDVVPRDRDPFYGAQWDSGGDRWGDEPNATQFRPSGSPGAVGPREGSRGFTAGTTSAVLNDSPFLDMNQTKEFESAIVVAETGQVLGNLRWNIQRWSAPSLWGLLGPGSSTTVRRAECSEGASAEFQGLVDQYNQESFATVTGFAANSATLPPAPLTELASVIRQMENDPAVRAWVGGAATQDETNARGLSRQRAEAVRDYLVQQGLEASRITVEAYGADWAITPTADANSADTNRRVQVRVQR